MKLSKFILIFILILLMAWVYNIAQAQEDTDTQVSIVNLTVPATCQLLITNTDSSKTLTQDGASETAFDAGYIELDAGKPTLTVNANKQWKLSAKSSGFAQVNGYNKAIGDLKLKDAGSAHVTNGFNAFKSLSGSDQEIASHTAGVSNESHPCQYKILLDWTKDIPGTYEATVTFTLSTNAS